MLELHVWGPGFGLPSIDPHCLAAIAYLQQAVPKGKWQLFASSDTSLSPSNELPALRNGDIWIGGFRNIFHYIAQHSGGEWILDAGLPEQPAADCVAFSSFIESNGQPLLDLSLFVSTLNYTTVTRPHYNKIQSFPLPYLTPPALRAAAKARTAHLNLSSLDIDSSSEDGPQSQSPSIIPERLRKPKNTVSSLLAATPEAGVGIRLDSLARTFLDPLTDLKAKKQFFVSKSQFTSLDCLALGYLSLMIIPELPQPWLSRLIVEKYPGLTSWVKDVRQLVYGEETSLYDAFLIDNATHNLGQSEDRGQGHLPWAQPRNSGLFSVGTAFVAGLTDSIPVIGQMRRAGKEQHYNPKTQERQSTPHLWQTATIVTSIIAGLGIGLGYLFHQGILVLPANKDTEAEPSTGLRDFGEAGAALSVLVGQKDRPGQVERNFSHGEPVVEVDVNLRDGEVKTTDSIA